MKKLDNYILSKQFHVESFLKKRNVEIHNLDSLSKNWENHFFRVKDLSDEEIAEYLQEESFYIEGSLCMWSYGREILSFKEWDLVDQLWAYFIDALHAIIICGEAKKEFYFPDQPLQVKIEKYKRDLKITISDDKPLQLPQQTFCMIFLEAGKQFLKRLVKVDPSNNEYISRAQEVLDNFEK